MSSYRIAERLRIALLLSFISGFINAFTYITQNGRFAGIQTGNLISLSIYLAKGNFHQVINFLIPIFIFIIGQLFSYIARKWSEKNRISWPIFSSYIMFITLIVTAILTPSFSHFFTITSLTFISSIQIDTFPKMHGLNYASVMMTGNLKNASFQLIKGITEKNIVIIQTALKLFSVLISFSFGVIISTYLATYFLEYALYFAILPFLTLIILLNKEKIKQANK